MVGSIFGKLLARAGEPPDLVVSRTLVSARRAARYVGGARAAVDLARLSPGTRLILITTPHGAIEPTALALAHLSQLDFSRLFVCHASGMLTAAALEPLARQGAKVFSFHPLQSFPRNFRPSALLETARGIAYGVDGNQEALRMARRLARKLGGTTWEIPPERRVLYHAASVVASTHVAALASMLEVMFAALGGGRGRGGGRPFYRVYEPLIRSTLQLVKTSSPELALGGAIARGGVETLAQHLRAVADQSPTIGLPFSALCAQAISVAKKRGILTPAQIDAMRLAVAHATGIDLALVAP